MKATGHHPRLRRRLIAALLLPTLLIISFGTLSDYFVARTLTDDAYDQSIAGVAEGLAVTLERDRDHDLPMHFKSMMRTLERIDAPDTWRYLVIDAAGHVVDGDLELRAVTPPDDGRSTPRFLSARLHDADERMATLYYGSRGSRATIIVAETVVRRRRATQLIVGWMTAPNLVLVVLGTLVVLAGVRLALRPLDEVGRRIRAQGASELRPLSVDDTPRETCRCCTRSTGSSNACTWLRAPSSSSSTTRRTSCALRWRRSRRASNSCARATPTKSRQEATRSRRMSPGCRG